MGKMKQASMELHVVGAYGRQYATGDAFVADWEAGKDMACWPAGRPYLSIRNTEYLQDQCFTDIVCHLADGTQYMVSL